MNVGDVTTDDGGDGDMFPCCNAAGNDTKAGVDVRERYGIRKGNDQIDSKSWTPLWGVKGGWLVS